MTFTVSAVVKDNSQAALGFDALFFDNPSSGLNFFLLKNNVSVPDLQAKTANLILQRNDGREEMMGGILRMSFSLSGRLVLIRFRSHRL